jgi:hypothetical protein
VVAEAAAAAETPAATEPGAPADVTATVVKPAPGRPTVAPTTPPPRPTATATPPPRPGAAAAPPPPAPRFQRPAPPVPPMAASGYGPAWQPPQGPPQRTRSNGLIIGIVAAAIVVLAGAGVGTWLALKDDDGSTGTDRTTTTVVGKTTTTRESTTSTGIATTTTVNNGTTSTSGSTTTSRSTTTTAVSTTTTHRPSTTTTEDVTTAYLLATDRLVAHLEYDDERVHYLALNVINTTVPNVPTWVRDELSTMLDILDADIAELADLEVPADFEESDYWLGKATEHMANRIWATIQAIEIMWDTGKTSSATPYLDEGRTERTAYQAAFEKYHDTKPIG